MATITQLAKSPSIVFLYGCYDKTLDLCPFAAETPISIEVTNTWSRRSDFMALVFVAGEHGPSSSPLKQSVGYKKLKRIWGGRRVWIWRLMLVRWRGRMRREIRCFGRELYTFVRWRWEGEDVVWTFFADKVLLNEWPQPIDGSYA